MQNCLDVVTNFAIKIVNCFFNICVGVSGGHHIVDDDGTALGDRREERIYRNLVQTFEFKISVENFEFTIFWLVSMRFFTILTFFFQIFFSIFVFNSMNRKNAHVPAVGIDELMGCRKTVGSDGGAVTKKRCRKIIDMKGSKSGLIVSKSKFQRDSTIKMKFGNYYNNLGEL